MLTLIRGLPGSGKSTLAYRLSGQYADAVHLEADMYFEKDGVYKFEPHLLPEAHSWCQEEAAKGLDKDCHVYVSNTFSKRWELAPYFKMARDRNITPTIINLFNNGLTLEQLAARNVHGVPADVIERMWSRWEHVILL